MTAKPKIPDEVVFDNEHLIDPFTGVEISINRVTADALGLCDGTHTQGEIAQEIASRYDIEVAEVIPDVEEIIQSLEEMKILDTRDRAMRKFATRFNSAYRRVLRAVLGS
jgi:hypothetical protein